MLDSWMLLLPLNLLFDVFIDVALNEIQKNVFILMANVVSILDLFEIFSKV